MSILHTSLGHPIHLVRKLGVKRLTLRFSKRHQGFVCTAPYLLSSRKIEAFLEKATPWIEKTVAKGVDKGVVFANGADIPLLGALHTIRFYKNVKYFAHVKEGAIEVFGPDEACIDPLLRQLLKRIAFEKAHFYSDAYAKRLEKTISKITMKDMTSRYGSCSRRGNLNYNWRIVLAPESVLRYVCAHEVAHLKEMNHSEVFWETVAFLDPAYKEARKWLKSHGATLF